MKSEEEKKQQLFVGLDVGTDSVGYAVTDGNYNLLKKHGEPMWGSHVFERANSKEDRRAFRTARRRLDRRQQRITLLQDIFAPEIAKVDSNFFLRLKESGLRREDTSSKSTYTFFEDEDFSDITYGRNYPTIHHLIQELYESTEEHDIRLVYMACAWFMAHRGHFLNEVDKDHIQDVLDFDVVYDDFIDYYNRTYNENEDWPLWECDKSVFQEIMTKKISISRKEKAFLDVINSGKKLKDDKGEDGARVNRAALLRLLSGGSLKTDKIFPQVSSEEAETVSLAKDEEEFATVVANLDDDGELLLRLRKIYDWALLVEILDGEHNKKKTLSAAKVNIYDTHKEDLQNLKAFVRKYLPEKYGEIFRAKKDTNNYAAYSGHESLKNCKREDFYDFLKKQMNAVDATTLDEESLAFYQDMTQRIETQTFLPKQVNGDNRVIPYQLYYAELSQILKNAKEYLPFLVEEDEEGYTNADKILSIFEFRIPYYVGPLNAYGENSWMKRKEGAIGKIYPWNFKDMVDEEESETAFINRMTNQCSYLPGKDVLPKNSFLYTRYTVLNEINNIAVNGQKIPVEVKQLIFSKFQEYRTVSVKKIEEVLKSNGCMQEGDVLSGIDTTKVNSSLSSYHAFHKFLQAGSLTEEDAEKITTRLAYTDDKVRMKHWLEDHYPTLSEDDNRYIRNLKLKDFGRLSKEFLTELRGVDKETGEVMTIIEALWNTNDNLMQLLSDRYTFMEEIKKYRAEFYVSKDMSLEDYLDGMYLSNSVKRPIYRALAILKDIRKATRRTPTRIFIEMARGDEEKKRTKSRRQQIEEYYAEITEDTRALSEQLSEKTDNELQSEVLFLYFMQLGKCMYSGEPIDIELLKTDRYNVDHIWPQSKVKDDSISNKVLVLSKLNGEKGDSYPINPVWQRRMAPFWKMLLDHKMITEKKYQRLTRVTRFTDEELAGFINRQLVETRQSTKALATILGQFYPEAEIVYSRAGVVSDFRKNYDLLKSRAVNDLHHGKDAYLNIVCGNVYFCKFTRPMQRHKFSYQKYNIKTDKLFAYPVMDDDVEIWAGEADIARVKKIMAKDHLHYTRFAFERRGGLFDQMPVKKGSGAVPRKANLPMEYYGGYNKSTATFFLLVQYQEKKKVDLMIMPVDLYCAERVMQSEETARAYAKENIAKILGKDASEITVLGLPLGLRKIKINTIFAVDGYRMALTGKANNGNRVLFTLAEPLVLKKEEAYVKRLESFANRKKEKRVKEIDPAYDKITRERNLELYDLLEKKALDQFFGKKLKVVIEILANGKETFSDLALEDQCDVLLNMVQLFKTGRSGGCDLFLIGGTKKTAAVYESSKISNWNKTYTDVRIIDTSASGIYESKSQNLLELL